MPTRRPREDPSDEEPDDVPLHHKKAYGTGLKRKRVEFVKARTSDETTANSSLKQQNASAISDLYASIVMGGSKAAAPEPASENTKDEDQEGVKKEEEDVCEICGFAVGRSREAHEATLAHQVSLQHSHPPSHLDRKRMGLKALKSHGWDPDARTGLGREGEGRRFPIKVTAKEDALGIGASLPEVKEKEAKEKMLDAKQMKKQAERDRRKGEKLSKEIFGRVDVEAYLKGDTKGGDGLR